MNPFSVEVLFKAISVIHVKIFLAHLFVVVREDFECLEIIVMILMNALEEKTITVTTGPIVSITLVVTNVIASAVGKVTDFTANNLIFVH